MADRLIFNLDDKLFGFDTKSVDKIVEMERVFFLPGSSGILSGIISLSGEPVTVVDARRAVGVKPMAPAPPEAVGAVAHRIIVLRDSERLLGYDVGPAEVSFLWELDPAAKPDGGEEEASYEAQETQNVELIDWTVDYDKALDILEGQNA